MNTPRPAWPRLILLAAALSCLPLVSPALTQASRGKKFALLVGVTEYDSNNFSALRYTGNDAEKMAEALKGAGFAEVRVLTNKRGEKDAKDAPTADNIRAALKDLLAGKTKRDTVLVGLAGHGVDLEVGDPDDTDKARNSLYFCPKDASKQGISFRTGRSKQLILMDDLFEALGRCDAGHKLALIDACRNEDRVLAGERRIDAGKVTIPDGVAALFSCGRRQVAWETAKLGGGHGVFFHFVIQGIKGEAKNRRGVVTWDSLADYVKAEVSEQVPTLIGGMAKQSPASMGNLEGESPVLALIGKAVAEQKDKGKGDKGELVAKHNPGLEDLTKGAFDKDGKNGIGMKFVFVKKGKFTMGSPREEKGRVERMEAPRAVEIKEDFYLGSCEVTQKEFRAVVGYNPSRFSHNAKAKQGAEYRNGKPGDNKDRAKGLDTEDFPVENVSYNEAEEFIDALNKREAKRLKGWRYRLPTEEQWEYACRGGAESSTKPFHIGEPGDSLDSAQANFDGRSPYGDADKGKYLERPCAVRSYKPNRLGLYQMHGNVEEWCYGWWEKAGEYRTTKGGNWNFPGVFSRAARGSGGSPTEYRADLVGFRVALVPFAE